MPLSCKVWESPTPTATRATARGYSSHTSSRATKSRRSWAELYTHDDSESPVEECINGLRTKVRARLRARLEQRGLRASEDPPGCGDQKGGAHTPAGLGNA